jgi:hypothetical protein
MGFLEEVHSLGGIMSFFREPKVVELCPSGDRRTFLFIMELNQKEIVGGSFHLSEIQIQTQGLTRAYLRGLRDAVTGALDRWENFGTISGGASVEAFNCQ